MHCGIYNGILGFQQKKGLGKNQVPFSFSALYSSI